MPPTHGRIYGAADLTGVDEGKMSKSIDDMLSDEPLPETEVVEEVAEVEAEAVEAPERPRGPDGKFISKETGVETPQEPEAVAEPVPPTEQPNQLPKEEFTALKDERRKRQELERELTYLREQAQKQPTVQQPPVDFWDDPNAFLTQLRTDMRTEILGALKEEQQDERMNASEAAAIAKHPDYPEAFAAFQQAVQYNPRLAQELARAPDPGEYAYSKGRAALALEQHGSIDALLAAERQKWESEVRAAVPQPQRLPSTTAADGTVGARRGPEWTGPTPLTDILR